MKMTTIAAAGLLMLSGQAVAQTLPDSIKEVLDSRFGSGQWRPVNNPCSQGVLSGDFNSDGLADYVLKIENGKGSGLFSVYVSGGNGAYFPKIVQAPSPDQLRRQSVQISKTKRVGKLLRPKDDFVVGVCGGSEGKRRYVYNTRTQRFDDSAEVAATPAPVAASGGCTIRRDFTLPVGENAANFELDYPAANADARIELTFHSGDQSRFYGPLIVSTFNKAAGEESTVRGVAPAVERVSGGMQFRPPGFWDASARGRPDQGNLSFGQFYSSALIPKTDRHDRLKVKMRQGVGANPDATVTAEIRIIGGSCGGTP